MVKENLLDQVPELIRRVIVHRKVAEGAGGYLFLLFADPRGIGFAFHRAGRPKNKKR